MRKDHIKCEYVIGKDVEALGKILDWKISIE